MTDHILTLAKNEARVQIEQLADSEEEKLAMERGMIILADLLEEEL